jgi:putative transposase
VFSSEIHHYAGSDIGGQVSTTFVQETADEAVNQWRETADRLRDRFPKLAALMDEAEHDVLAFMQFPKAESPRPTIWKKIASTNPLERVNKEIKRRANVIGIFPNDAAIMRLVGTLVIEQTEEWHLTRRCMSYESLARVVRPESAERLLEKQAVA